MKEWCLGQATACSRAVVYLFLLEPAGVAGFVCSAFAGLLGSTGLAGFAGLLGSTGLAGFAGLVGFTLAGFALVDLPLLLALALFAAFWAWPVLACPAPALLPLPPALARALACALAASPLMLPLPWLAALLLWPGELPDAPASFCAGADVVAALALACVAECRAASRAWAVCTW